MRVWRICERRVAHKAFNGEGAKVFGGRWNPAGVAVVYTASSLALAVLEILVHTEPNDLPTNLVAISATIPKSVRIASLSTDDLPRNWREFPTPETIQDIGLKWLKGKTTAVLRVPSVVVAQETNYLIDPAHPDSSRIVIEPPLPYSFDPRLWKSSRPG